MRFPIGLHVALIFTVAVFLLPRNAISGDTPLTNDADSQYAFAKSRLDAGAFDEAAVEFNRFIFYFPDDRRVPQARFQIGMAHFAAGKYLQAAMIFDRLTENYAGLPYQNEAFIMLSRCHARQGLNDQAMLDLRNLMALTANKDISDEARYELGWLQVNQSRWGLAGQEFNRISPANQDRYQVSRLQQALARSGTIPSKNPTVAGVLSIIPGGGQLYCGRYRDALTALVVNAGLIWAAWEAFDEDLYALGGVITFVEFGFYAGNITGAVSSAHKYNRDRSGEFRENMYRLKQPPLSLAPVPGGAGLFLSVSF